jgi:hypothetical protein
MRLNANNHRKDHCYRQVAARPIGRDDKEPGFFGRLYAAFMESRQHEANRQIARLLSQSGGRLTDDMERRFSEHLIGKGSFFN